MAAIKTDKFCISRKKDRSIYIEKREKSCRMATFEIIDCKTQCKNVSDLYISRFKMQYSTKYMYQYNKSFHSISLLMNRCCLLINEFDFPFEILLEIVKDFPLILMFKCFFHEKLSQALYTIAKHCYKSQQHHFAMSLFLPKFVIYLFFFIFFFTSF